VVGEEAGVTRAHLRRTLVAASTLAAAAVGARPATGCSCRPLDAGHVKSELEEAKRVFVGRVRALQPIAGAQPSPLGTPARVTLTVARRWKGPAAPSYTVIAGPLSEWDTCAARLEPGETYLIFAFAETVGMCRVWKQGGEPPFAAVGTIIGMKAVVEELDRLVKRPSR
jgi:hypothetical protein